MTPVNPPLDPLRVVFGRSTPGSQSGNRLRFPLAGDMPAFRQTTNCSFDFPPVRVLEGRSHHAAAKVVRSQAIVIFGGSNSSTCFEETLVFRNPRPEYLLSYNILSLHPCRPGEFEWDTASGPAPCGRRGHTLTPLDDNRLLLFGGTTRTASFNDLYLFDAVIIASCACAHDVMMIVCNIDSHVKVWIHRINRDCAGQDALATGGWSDWRLAFSTSIS